MAELNGISAEKKPNFQWYIIHTYSGHEEKVRTAIEKKINNDSKFAQNVKKAVVLKEMKTISRKTTKDGKEITKEVEKEVVKFPGYVFVNMNHTKESWYDVRNITGCTGFVGPDPLTPTPLQVSDVYNLRLDGDVTTEPTRKVNYREGDKIYIIAGGFEGMTGTVVKDMPEKRGIKVKIFMFGRDSDAELEYAQVELLSRKEDS